MINKKNLDKLIEIRDNMHKKTYLKKEFSSCDLENTLDYVLKFVGKSSYKDNKNFKIDNIENIHKVLFRISSRLLTRIFKEKYNKRINSKFSRLCKIKDHYWKIYLTMRTK